MKLLVIVICLLSERYLTHSLGQKRFNWFINYVGFMDSKISNYNWLSNPYAHLACLILPLLIPIIVLVYLFNAVLFGFGELLIDLAVFYYCLGPDNAFYPFSENTGLTPDEREAKSYLYAVNNQLFAVIFWFIFTGPIGVFCYRLVSLSVMSLGAYPAARIIREYLDWITVRVTLLLYMLAGNFQRGLGFFSRNFLSSVQNNQTLLETGGLKVAGINNNEVVTLLSAQNLVEYALIIYLVFIGVFTLASWL